VTLLQIFRHRVNLDPVAGGDHYGFPEHFVVFEKFGESAHLLLVERQALAQFDRSCPVVLAQKKNRHRVS